MALHVQPTIAGLIGLSPHLGLLGAVIFVAFLFVRDVRQRPNITGAVWLPVIWVVLMGIEVSSAMAPYFSHSRSHRFTGRRKSHRSVCALHVDNWGPLRPEQQAS